MQMFSLLNKTILVTGASSGIGRGCAQALASQGARCILAARNKDRLLETMNGCVGSGHELLEWDMTDDVKRDSMVEALPELDGLVYCAGVPDNQTPLKFLKPDFVDYVIGVNLRAPILLMASLAKRKKIRKGGSALFITSFSPIHGSPAHSAYMAAKAGLYGFVHLIVGFDPAKKQNYSPTTSFQTKIITFAVKSNEHVQREKNTEQRGRPPRGGSHQAGRVEHLGRDKGAHRELLQNQGGETRLVHLQPIENEQDTTTQRCTLLFDRQRT